MVNRRDFLFSTASVLSAGAAFTTFPPVAVGRYREGGPERSKIYVAPDGDDAHPGTQTRPVRTLDQANRMVHPGATVIVREGVYSGTIAPQRSGKPWAPVTYRSEPRRKAVFREGGADSVFLRLEDRDHVTVQGFRVEKGYYNWIQASGCTGITLKDCYMERSGENFRPIEFTSCSHLRILDNRFKQYHVQGDICIVLQCDHVLVEGNAFDKSGHGPFAIDATNYAVVRGNCFHNSWGRNYALLTAGKVLVENNLVTLAVNSAYSADSMSKTNLVDSIYRFNQVYENKHTPITSSSYVPQADWRPYIHEPYRLVNTHVYHNTFTDNLGPAWSFWGMNISENVFANNIFFANDPYGAHIQLDIDDDISEDNRFHNNVIAGAETGEKTILYGDRHMTTMQAEEESQARGGYWREFQDNLDVNPAFRDPENRDYRLSSESPCISSGKALTRTTSAGSGRRIPVVDAGYFFDGFGIPNETADLIQVGTDGPHVRIEEVESNYYQPDIVVVDRSVDWEENDPVSLPWTGSAPDIGSHQQSALQSKGLEIQVQPTVTRPGDRVQMQARVLDKPVASIRWHLGNGALATGTEINHQFDTAGNYPVRVCVEYQDGTRGRDVFLVKVEQEVDSDAPLVYGNFEDESIEEWGYIFDFTRHRNTEYERVDGGFRGGKCMHLYSGETRFAGGGGSILGASLQPGAWRIDEYPFVEFAYRIPEGVPVGVCVQAFHDPAYGDMEGMVMLGGTSARESGPYPDLDQVELVDDGSWREAECDVRGIRQELPDVDVLYRFRFYTHRNARPKHEFWFDEFAILPSS